MNPSAVAAIRSCLPEQLAGARDVAHHAVQLLYKAAIVNLRSEPDDSHSNLGWDSELCAYTTRSLHAANRQAFAVGLDIETLTLLGIEDGAVSARLSLDGLGYEEAAEWVDEQLVEQRLTPIADTAVAYDLPDSVVRINRYSGEGVKSALRALAGWIELGNQLLVDFAARHKDIDPGPSPVRCWPHHFDLATYVSLEDGDPETARGIGVGLSPGDQSYDQPYFYISPYPTPAASAFPEPPSPGHWHTASFVGAAVTATQLLSTDEPQPAAAQFVEEAFLIGWELLNRA